MQKRQARGQACLAVVMRGKGLLGALPFPPHRPGLRAGTCKDGTAFSNRKATCTVFALEAKLHCVPNGPGPEAGAARSVADGRKPD